MDLMFAFAITELSALAPSEPDRRSGLPAKTG